MTLARFLATFAGVGLLKPGPGTWGSAAALAVAAFLWPVAGSAGMAAAAVLLFAAGVWASGAYAAAIGVKDPSEVVIDEAAGIFLVFALVPLTLLTALAGFVAFRFFDIVKPWPISWANERVPGAFGIMIDDTLAALAAAGVLWITALLYPGSLF